MYDRSESRGELSSQSGAREIIYDLRNLFGVVASARNLLADTHTASERLRMLHAIKEAACRGGQLTARLLSDETGANDVKFVDVGDQIAELAPMLQALVSPGATLEVDTQIALPASIVRMDPAELEAAILELVANARAAGAHNIHIRCRKVGRWIWTLVADDGHGFSRNKAQVTVRPVGWVGHGIGLDRVRRAVRDANGELLIRGKSGSGAVIAMVLPVALCAVGNARAQHRGAFPKPKESGDDQERRTAAA